MKKFLKLALSAALLLALFGCGSPKEKESDDKDKPSADLIKTELKLPGSTSAETATTGEAGSKMFKFIGDDFTKIQGALPGSKLEITYTATVEYAIGEAGWISIDNAGPVMSGNGKKQTVYYDIEDLVLGTEDFTLHIFNGATLLEVNLYLAEEGYEVKGNELATAGATKIVLPKGHKITGRGDLSKVDFKKITTAADTKKLVFYFDDKADTESGILKFGPKGGPEYKHYGIDEDKKPYDEKQKGWRRAELTDNEKVRKIEYTIKEIKDSIPAAAADAATDPKFKNDIFNKLEINNDASGAEGELLYIEVK